MKWTTTTAVFFLALVAGAPELRAETSAGSVDELLAEGWRFYSEELDFESAAQAYLAAATHPDVTRTQKLEALEYLAGSFFALGDYDEARHAMQELISINPDQRFQDPSHPPEFLELLEEVRQNQGEASPARPPATPAPAAATAPPPERETERRRPARKRPFYRTWWFWTITGAMVAGAAVTGIAVGVSQRGGATDVPRGTLDPGVVKLPCTGFSF